MPLIKPNIHLEGMALAQLPGFPVCVGFITFGSVSFKGESKTIRNPVIVCQFELNPVFYTSRACVLRY